MKLHCPCCHAQFSIEALTQDEAARELLALRATMLPSLLPYLTLFRSAKRALAFDRALKLAREVMAMDPDSVRLETALANTVESLRQKRDAGLIKPLKDHKYLKSVLENTATSAGLSSSGVSAAGHEKPISKRAAAVVTLADWSGCDWLRQAIAAGLSALIVQSLKYQPPADMICMNADIWQVALKKVCTIEEVDGPRIRSGFERLFSQVTEWPKPKELLELMPARPPRRSLPEPPPSEEDRRRGKEKFDELMSKMENG